jgi:hypothetical protein
MSKIDAGYSLGSSTMTDKDYSKTILVDASPQDAYVALTSGFEKWWTTPDKPIRVVGDCAVFTFPPGKGSWTFRATNLVPGEHVDLDCIEANHIHEGMPDAIREEWLGTTLSWRIFPEDGKTVIRFVHSGLRPNLHCFDICESGWDYFFVDSLKAYLDTGVGMPHSE